MHTRDLVENSKNSSCRLFSQAKRAKREEAAVDNAISTLQKSIQGDCSAQRYMGAIDMLVRKSQCSSFIKSIILDTFSMQLPKLTCDEFSQLFFLLCKLSIRWEDIRKHNNAYVCVLDKIIAKSHVFNEGEIISLLISLARMGFNDLKFYSYRIHTTSNEESIQRCVLEIIKRNITSIKDTHLSELLWALSILGVEWNDLHEATLAQNILQLIGHHASYLDAKHISKIWWSLAHLKINWEEIKRYKVNTRLFLDDILVDSIYRHLPEIISNDIMARQFGQAKLWFGINLRQDLEETYRNGVSLLNAPKSSKFHLRIANKIRQETDAYFTNECRIEGVIWVDIYFHDYNLAIEIDGIAHDNNKNSYKEELLALTGVRVARITYLDSLDSSALREFLFKNGIPLRPKTPSVASNDDSYSSQRSHASSRSDSPLSIHRESAFRPFANNEYDTSNTSSRSPSPVSNDFYFNSGMKRQW